MAMVPSETTTIPILPLAYPLILLPAARITLPLSKEQARAIIAHLQANSERGTPPTKNVLGALPILPPSALTAVSSSSDAPKATAETAATSTTADAPLLSKWGCVARIIKLVRPSPLQQSGAHIVVLQGLNRFQLLDTPSYTRSELSSALKSMRVTIPPSDLRTHPNPSTVRDFKETAIKLLTRLNKDTSSTNTSKKEAWLRLTDLMDEIEDERLAWFADVMVGAVAAEYNDKLDYLCTSDPETRLVKSISMFTKQASISEVTSKISSAVSESLSKQQKEFFLRQQLDAIQRELSNLTGDKGGDFHDDERGEQDEMADLKRKIEAMAEGSEHRKMAIREYRRLKRIPQGSVEQSVIRSYLEWLTAVPWPSADHFFSPESSEAMRQSSFLTDARAQLDSDHFGLDKIKKRLVEYLAIVRLKHILSLQEAAAASKAANQDPLYATPPTTPSSPNTPAPIPSSLASAAARPKSVNRAPILLFVGPPGVGKTSLGQSVAKALHRPFQRISLGGVRDEAEIRGHRRTYVASGPGMIIQALRRAGRPDPVLLLDEIDKVGQSNFHGDPSAALLEVLDPEQNHAFNDHYINVPVDLSQILFICTANTLDTISAPLLDRCEVIQLSGYTYDEKMAIARRWLVPKQLGANGMKEGMVEFTGEAMEWVATRYTREAGVRSLERAIGGVVRAKAVEWAEFVDASSSSPSFSASSTTTTSGWKKVVKKEDLEIILGPPRWDGEEREREERRGLAWGLVVMGMGEGAIMPVETIAVPGSGKLKLTGSLGDVIKESGEIALSWVKTHAYALSVTSKPSEDPLAHPDPIDIHLHLPSGAQKKDGPSAGVAMVCAFVSLLTGATVGRNVAMTGEITLRGRVTPVGGIKEKVLGAHRAKIRKVILPYANRQDAEQDIPKEIRAQIELVYVRNLEEALREAFGSQLDWRVGAGHHGPGQGQVESRL